MNNDLRGRPCAEPATRRRRCGPSVAFALALLSAAPACETTRGGDPQLRREVEPLRADFERHGEWVSRTLQSHAGDRERSEVLFSPLRLEGEVLEAEVEVPGQTGARYALREGGTEPPSSDGWTSLTRSSQAPRLSARRGTCEQRPAKGGARVACIWLRMEDDRAGPMLGFVLRVAYRTP